MNAYPFNFPHGLMFHRIHQKGGKQFGQGSISDEQFEQILIKVGVNRILSPLEWIKRLKTGALGQKDVCVTFDDGLSGQFNYALPVLEKFGIQAFWFIYSSVVCGSIDKNEVASYLSTRFFNTFDDFAKKFFEVASIDSKVFETQEFSLYSVKLKASFSFYSKSDIQYRYARNFLLSREEFETIIMRLLNEFEEKPDSITEKLWMSEGEILELNRKGHYIGLHSYSHPFMLKQLSIKDQEEEYRKNYDHLFGVIRERIVAMAHPLNSYSEETLPILKKMGIECGFCSNPQNEDASNFRYLELPRVDSTDIARML